MESSWDVVVSSIQDTCNGNQRLQFTKLDSPQISNENDLEEAKIHIELFTKHKENLEKTKRILDTALINVNGLLSQQPLDHSGHGYSHHGGHGSLGSHMKLDKDDIDFMDLDDDEENISSSSRGSNGTGSGNGSGIQNYKDYQIHPIIMPCQENPYLVISNQFIV
ncbi:unnamed protein product [Ambrosiozyma monospora]|uniref:Unnamed protein product n=1 Tax=Ambrosiozyma monospora TaxID=43982 RepID=A0ACB5T5S0_AMBMO|nr:unnamed protein product [Ambrosiozyma monospora]